MRGSRLARPTGVRRARAAGALLALLAPLLAAAPARAATPLDLTVVAGDGGTTPVALATGSAATATGLNAPRALAADPSGNLVIADTNQGLVTLLARSAGNPGYLLPVGTSWAPGELYVLAGGGAAAPSPAGSVATETKLVAPDGVALDPAGDLVVSDSGDHEVEVLAEAAANPGYRLPVGTSWSPGELYVLAGGGTAAPSPAGSAATGTRLVSPAGVALDASGNLVLADSGAGIAALVAESPANPGYALPVGTSWSPGELYVLAGGGTTAPSPAGTGATASALNLPGGVAASPTGEVLIADTSADRVEALALAPGAPVLTSAVAGDGQVALSWSAPARDGGSPVTGYALDAFAPGAAVPSASATLGPNTTSATLFGLANAATYALEVRALSAIGESAASGTLDATPHAAATPPPTPTPTPTPPALSGAPGAGASAPPAGRAAPARRPAALVLRAPTVAVRGRRVAIALGCEHARCHGVIELTETRRVRVRLGGLVTTAVETTVVATGRFSVPANRARPVSVALTSAGRALLRGAPRRVALLARLELAGARPRLVHLVWSRPRAARPARGRARRRSARRP